MVSRRSASRVPYLPVCWLQATDVQIFQFDDIAGALNELKSRYPDYVWANSREFDELHGSLDSICALYLLASEEQRRQIRCLVAEPPKILIKHFLEHIAWAGHRLRASKDREQLRRALAAASIQDNRWDFRDTFRALGALYLVASSLGISCTPYFLEAAELSSAEKAFPSIGSMRDFLAGFEKSAYFADDVQPKIGRYLTARLRSEILAVLADVWDPLEVTKGKFSRKEYAGYVDDIYQLLVKNATPTKITEYLDVAARRRMEMRPPPSTRAAVRALRAIQLEEGQE